MVNLYFEEVEVGAISTAGPYLVSKDEIIHFATQYDPVPRRYRRGRSGAFDLWRADGIRRPYLCHVLILLTGRLQPETRPWQDWAGMS